MMWLFMAMSSTQSQALILVDTAGHVTVPSVRSLRNLLGDHPEPGLAITHACNGQFFVLDVSIQCTRLILSSHTLILV